MPILRKIVCADCACEMPDQKYPPQRCHSCQRAVSNRRQNEWIAANREYRNAYRRVYEKCVRGTLTWDDLDRWLAENGKSTKAGRKRVLA